MITGDNGLPFPRAKSNLYDSGTNVPLATRLMAELNATGDPQALGQGDVFDGYPYYGGQPQAGQKAEGKSREGKKEKAKGRQ